MIRITWLMLGEILSFEKKKRLGKSFINNLAKICLTNFIYLFFK
jgi:hypothetical protein